MYLNSIQSWHTISFNIFISWSTTVVHSGSSSIIIVEVVKVLWYVKLFLEGNPFNWGHVIQCMKQLGILKVNGCHNLVSLAMIAYVWWQVSMRMRIWVNYSILFKVFRENLVEKWSTPHFFNKICVISIVTYLYENQGNLGMVQVQKGLFSKLHEVFSCEVKSLSDCDG
jgi:hypothetical protein